MYIICFKNLILRGDVMTQFEWLGVQLTLPFAMRLIYFLPKEEGPT